MLAQNTCFNEPSIANNWNGPWPEENLCQHLRGIFISKSLCGQRRSHQWAFELPSLPVQFCKVTYFMWFYLSGRLLSHLPRTLLFFSCSQNHGYAQIYQWPWLLVFYVSFYKSHRQHDLFQTSLMHVFWLWWKSTSSQIFFNLLLVLKTSEKLVACFFSAAEAWKSSKKLGKQLNTKLEFPVEVLGLKVWWVTFRTQQWCHKECSYCRHYQTKMYHRRFPRSKMVPVRKLFHDINILSFESKKDMWAVF